MLILPAISVLVSFIAQYFYPKDVRFFIVIFYYLSILFIVTIVYSLYPLFAKSFFEKVDDKRVIEFEFIKNVLWIGFPILFIAEIFWYFFYYTFMSYNFVLLLQAFNISLFFGGFVRFKTQTTKRESRFYFAKGYCKIITTKHNIFDKMKYLFLALDSYNKYLRRNTKHEIKSIGIIYSKCLSLPLKEKDEIITKVCKSLNMDHFELANYLSLFANVPNKEFFIRESILQKLKSIGIFLAAAIPIIISLIEFIFGIGK